jgi:hypothetical protein
VKDSPETEEDRAVEWILFVEAAKVDEVPAEDDSIIIRMR